MASFVGFGQRPQLSPQSPTRFFPTLSDSKYDGESIKKTDRKYMLLRNPQGWYYNIPESALETSPEVAPRVLPPSRPPVDTPRTPLLLPSGLPQSPLLLPITISPPNGGGALGLGLSLGNSTADNTSLSPFSSEASGALASGPSDRSPWSPPQEVTRSPVRPATGLSCLPSTSTRPNGVDVGLRLVSSWSPSPRPALPAILAPQHNTCPARSSGLLPSHRPPTYPPGLALEPDLSSLPLEVPSAFEIEPISVPFSFQASVDLITPPFISCYDPNDEIIARDYVRGVPSTWICSRFASFIPTHRIGGGAQGRVVRVEHCRTGNAYALKVVHKGAAAKRKFSRKNFLTERNVMMAVNESETASRFLMSMLMCWEDIEKDLIYFVMPLYPTDLATTLTRKEVIPVRDRYLWCKELMCALVHLYYIGILHLDIKPANILIDHAGRAVLTDFGNAKEVAMYDYASWKGYSRDGTYCYMAPEMVSADVHRVGYGTGVDVWSMALVFMEIIGFCDGPFFHQRTIDGIQNEHANSGRLPINPDKFLCSDERFWEILPEMLQVDPKKRITVQQLEDKYIRSEDWALIRDGFAIHGWRADMDLPPADVEDATYFLDFTPSSNIERRYGIDSSEFEYCAPGVF